MKHTKKWLALALALCLAVTLAVPAFAITVTWDMLKNGYDYNGTHINGNSVLADESAYTPETVAAAVTAYQHYQDAEPGSQAEKDAYNNEYKPAILGLKFKANDFSDVADGMWYAPAVDYAEAAQMMNGVGNGRFDPDGTMSRAMAVTILWRINGSERAKPNASFTDVPENEWYTDAVAWAVENKITLGTTSTTFDPNTPVTREQMAAFFSRVILMLAEEDEGLGLPEAQMRTVLARQYSDADQISPYALEHVLICLETGVMKGNADGTFAPKANITRAQGAQMLMNYYYFLINATFLTI